MGGRYLVTGVQLGMLKGPMLRPSQFGKVVELVDEIIEKQFVGDSEKPVEEDAEVIINLDWEERP